MTENNVQNEPQAKKSKKGLIIGIIVALLAVGGAVAGALMLTGNKGEEETAYALLEDNDNPADYEQFLADYPNSILEFRCSSIISPTMFCSYFNHFIIHISHLFILFLIFS